MAIEFRLPELGENIDSGDLIRILVAEGDRIEKDQPVLELETDKATIEVPSPVSGTVRQIHVQEGTKIKVGQLIFTLEDGVGAQPEQTPAPAASRPESEGRKAAPELPVAAAEVPAPEPLAPSTVPAARAEESEEAVATAVAELPAVPREETGRVGAVIRMPFRPTEARRALVPAAPSVRRLAREIGVDIAEVSGSGPGGRITMEDVKAHAKALLSERSRTAAPAAPAPAA